MLIGVKLEKLPVGAVRLPIGVLRVRVRGIVLLRREQCLRVSLLELRDMHLPARRRLNELAGNVHLAKVIAADLGDQPGASL